MCVGQFKALGQMDELKPQLITITLNCPCIWYVVVSDAKLTSCHGRNPLKRRRTVINKITLLYDDETQLVNI